MVSNVEDVLGDVDFITLKEASKNIYNYLAGYVCYK